MAEPVSILVYSGVDLMGDGLMKLPFLRALRHAFPQASVTWLAGIGPSVYAGPLAPLTAGLIDEVIANAGIGRHWRELWRRPLAHRRFDIVIDTQRRAKTTLIVRRIRHGVFISGALDYRLSSARPPGWTGKKRRMVDNMLDLVAAAAAVVPRLDRGIQASPLDAVVDPRGDIPDIFKEAAALTLPDGPAYIGLAPGAGGQHKRWPLENYIELARLLAAEGKVPAFILGPDEQGWKDALQVAVPEALFPLQSLAVDAKLAASPLFTIAVAAQLKAAVANDSGTGHLLAAADIPLVSLFGPTDPAKFAPYVSRAAIIRSQDFHGGEMGVIPLSSVLEAVRRIDPP